MQWCFTFCLYHLPAISKHESEYGICSVGSCRDFCCRTSTPCLTCRYPRPFPFEIFAGSLSFALPCQFCLDFPTQQFTGLVLMLCSAWCRGISRLSSQHCHLAAPSKRPLLMLRAQGGPRVPCAQGSVTVQLTQDLSAL